MRNDRENLRFDPRLPAQWTSIKHHMLIGDSHMLVKLERDAITFQILSGHDREVTVRGELHHIGVEPVRIPLGDQGPLRPSLRGTHPISGLRRADGSLITAEVPGSIAETIVSSPILPSRD